MIEIQEPPVGSVIVIGVNVEHPHSAPYVYVRNPYAWTYVFLHSSGQFRWETVVKGLADADWFRIFQPGDVPVEVER